MKSLKKQVGGNHYSRFHYQPIEFCINMNLSFIQGNIVKYITRHPYKNGAEDVKKAKQNAEIAKEFDLSYGPHYLESEMLRYFNTNKLGSLEYIIIGGAVYSHWDLVIEYCDKILKEQYESVI